MTEEQRKLAKQLVKYMLECDPDRELTDSQMLMFALADEVGIADFAWWMTGVIREGQKKAPKSKEELLREEYFKLLDGLRSDPLPNGKVSIAHMHRLLEITNSLGGVPSDDKNKVQN